MQTTRLLWKSTAMLSLLALVAGCGTSNSGGSAGTGTGTTPGSSQEPAKPLELTWMVPLFNPEPPQPDGEPMKKLEQLIGGKLALNWVPSATYLDKLTASIAANDLPKVVSLSDDKQVRNSVISNAVKSGMFWELGPYLKDYPNLSKLSPIILGNTSYGGKIYGIYRERDLSKTAIVIRKDWLDHVGLKEPKTVDDLVKIARAFTTGDPDKNGKADTMGFTENRDMNMLMRMNMWLGGDNEWKAEGDKLVSAFTTPEYLEAMKVMRTLATEKLINQDFLLVDNNKKKENFLTGKAGLYVGDPNDIRSSQADFKKLYPDGKLVIVNRITGPKGERVHSSGGHAGLVMIPKTSVKSESELKQILKALDILNGKDAIDTMTYGILGRTYETIDGNAKTTNAELAKKEVTGLGLLGMSKMNVTPKQPADELEKSIVAAFADNAKIAVANPAEPLESKSNAEIGATINKQLVDAQNKFILGSLDEAGWKKAVEDWRKAGGDKIAAELSEEYKKALQAKK